MIASIRTLCNLFCLLTADISRVTIKSTAFYRVGSRKMNSSAKVYPMYLCPKGPLHFWSTSSTLLFPTWVNQKSGSLLSKTQETSTPNPFLQTRTMGRIHPHSQGALPIVLCFISMIIIYFWITQGSTLKARDLWIPSFNPPSLNTQSPMLENEKWVFNKTRDAKAYGLTEAQCVSAFPGLYAEIDRAAGYRKNIGNVKKEELDISWKDDGAVRALIFEQQVCKCPYPLDIFALF